MGDAIITRRGGANQRLQYLITSSSTFTVEKSGKYRIVAIGHGAYGSNYTKDGSAYVYPGGCGGGGYIEKFLTAGQTYPIVILAGYSDFADGLLRATAGVPSPSRDYASYAGTVTGTAPLIVPFASNGLSGQIDIIPPAMYNSFQYVSPGGRRGCIFNADGSLYSAGTIVGGNGLFGPAGGDGGPVQRTSISPYFVLVSATPPAVGAGSGARGMSQASISPAYVAGTAGGGAYGGGGMAGQVAFWSDDPYRAPNGQGAEGCVFIDLI